MNRVLRCVATLAFLAPLLLAAWNAYTSKGSDLTPKLLFAGLIIVYGLIFNRLVFPVTYTKMLLTAQSPLRYSPAFPDECRNLNKGELDRLTREWQDLGFVPVGDFIVAGPQLNTLSLFARFLEHESGAIVEVSHLLTARMLPFKSRLQSFWGESERYPLIQQAESRFNDSPDSPPLATSTASPKIETVNPIVADLKIWSLLTANSTQDYFEHHYFRFLSHPRLLRCRLPEHASPLQLWQAHQQRFALVAERLGEPALRGDLIPLFRAHREVLAVLVSCHLKVATPRALFQSYYTRPPAPFFDGELAPLNASTHVHSKNVPLPPETGSGKMRKA